MALMAFPQKAAVAGGNDPGWLFRTWPEVVQGRGHMGWVCDRQMQTWLGVQTLDVWKTHLWQSSVIPGDRPVLGGKAASPLPASY